MKINRKLIRWAIIPAMMWSLTGCGGFRGSQSVSPASFFLPGILKAEPKPFSPDSPVSQPQTEVQVALAQ